MENKLYIYNNEFRIENAVKEDALLRIEGYCAHWNKANLNHEVVDYKSFDNFFEMYNAGKLRPALNYNHSADLIGGIDNLERTDTGLYIKCHLNRNISLVRDMVEPCIDAGDLTSFSTEGYVEGGWDGITELDNDNYYVKSFLLTAVAVVAVPADYEARFTVANILQNAPKQEPAKPRKSIVYMW